MSKSKPIIAGLCLVALGFSGYEAYGVHDAERQLSLARDESTKQEKRASAVEAKIRELQQELEILKTETNSLGKFADEVNKVAGSQGAPIIAVGATKPEEGPPVPASEIMPERRITPISDEELARRIEAARERTPEELTPVTMADLANMPSAYEFGSGADRRMWHMVDASTYVEVYPDGSYSVFSILGRATVNGSSGTITTKDDGELDVFVPDKGGRDKHMLRFASPGSQWVDYADRVNVE